LPRSTRTARLHELARHGAQLRLRELLEEASSLVKLFPPLRDSFDPDELPVKFIVRRGAEKAALAAERQVPPATARTRRRRGWTAAQRKAAADRMSAYWAKRKKK